LSRTDSITTERLLLRRWCEDDHEPFAEMMADAEFNRYMPGPFDRSESDAMIEQLRVDYRAMQGMIFGDPPDFEAVLDSISSLETRLNENGASESGAAR